MVSNIESRDEGKEVMTADGEKVGAVDRISGGKTHVKPESGISRSMRRKFGWSAEGKETYELKKDHVDSITGDGIRIRKPE